MSTRTQPGRLGPGIGLFAGAFAFAVTMAFSTLPTPLYVIYQHQLGFGRITVTMVFAVFAAGVVASLPLAAHLSDRIGRRSILVAAVLIEAAAAILFLTWQTLPGLVIARLASGIGVGLVVATATAHLAELYHLWRPSADPRRADQVAIAANMGGLGLGPLSSGLLATYLPGPLQTPYLVFLALLLVSATILFLSPQTTSARVVALPQPSVTTAMSPAYYAASAMAFVTFAAFGLFSALGPSLVSDVFGSRSRALAGVLPFVVFGAAATAQLTLAQAKARHQLEAGILGVTCGLALVTTGAWLTHLILFLLGGALTGAGAGVLFKGSLATVAVSSAPEVRGKALTGLFVAAYAGLTIPVIAVGIAVEVIPARDALLGFVAVMVVSIGLVRRQLVPVVPPSIRGLRQRLPGSAVTTA
jgi:MFS family permease